MIDDDEQIGICSACRDWASIVEDENGLPVSECCDAKIIGEIVD